MSFFQQIADLGLSGDLRIVITNASAGQLAVSLILNNERCGDDARKTIPPLLLRGTPHELDSGFFTTVGKPLQLVSGLQVDMESYLKGIEAAKKNSAMAKANAAPNSLTTTPAVDSKTLAYTKAMKTVEDLIKEKKYRDAIGKLPKANEYPHKKEILTARRNWLMTMELENGGMFPPPYPEDKDTTPAPAAGLTTEPQESQPQVDSDEDRTDDDTIDDTDEESSDNE